MSKRNLGLRSLILASLLVGSLSWIQIPNAHAATVYSFTSASATGATGPTQTQINTAYSGTSLDGLVTINTQGIQQWSVPASGTYQIDIAGATGGNGRARDGGRGASASIKVALVSGTNYSIVVGQKGTNFNANANASYAGGGGGGGSFIYKTSDNTYIAAIAGGGGGASNTTKLLTTQTTADGKVDTTAGSTVSIYHYVSLTYIAAGGTGGSGGGISTRNQNYGGPGAGVNSNGATSNGGQGKSRASAWLGGSGNGPYPAPGGFGGGGSAGVESSLSLGWAGGGGGYSGGGAGGNGGDGDGQYGGGGGSLYTGEFLSGSNGANTGVGYVTITALFSAQAALSFSLSTSSSTYTGSAYTQALTLTPAGGSGTGAITYAISGGTATTCALSSSGATPTITATTSGTCLITATKAADVNYSAISSSAMTFTFNKAVISALSLSLAGGVITAQKGRAIVITVAIDQVGKVSFFVDGKRIKNCFKLSASGSTRTCSWKPAVQKAVTLSAELTPTNSAYSVASGSLKVQVTRRTSTR